MKHLLRLVLILCVALAAAPLFAHPGHDHKIMGEITAIDGDFVTVKTTKGQERSFQLTAQTKILKGKTPGDRAHLVVGLRVVVNVGDGSEPLKAKSVQYAAAPAAKPTEAGTGKSTGAGAGSAAGSRTGAAAGAGSASGRGNVSGSGL